MANQPNKQPSGCLLVLMIIFFPYVLLYWLFKLLSNARKAPPEKAHNNALIFLSSGAFLFMVGIAYVAAGFAGELKSDNQEDIVFGMIVMFLIFCGGGLALMLTSPKYFKLSKLYNKYAPCILNSGILNIDQIAQIVNVDYNTAVKDLQYLLSKSSLNGAYIAHQSRTIVFPSARETSLAPQAHTVTKNTALIDVNLCVQAELMKLPGVGAAEALTAIEFRNRNGGFRSLDEFVEVLELKPHFAVQIFENATASPIAQNVPPRKKRTSRRRRAIDF